MNNFPKRAVTLIASYSMRLEKGTTDANSVKFSAYDWSVLVMGLTSRLWIPFGGQLYICELFAGGYFLINSPRILGTASIMRKLLLAGLIWILTQWFIDLMYQTQSHFTLKNISNITFTILLTAALCDGVLNMTLNRRKWIGIWVGSGIIVGSFLEPNLYFASNPMKWGIGLGICLILMGVSSYFPKFSKVMKIVFLFLSLALIISFDSRSLGGFLLLAFFLSLRKTPGSNSGIKRFVLIAVPTLLLLIFGLNFIASIVPNSQVATKINSDKGTKIGFLNSRTELFFELAAIKASPIIGYGSDPSRPPQELISSVVQSLNNQGISPFYKIFYADTLPVHSEIFGSMVRGGIFSIFFWLILLRFFWITSFSINKADNGLRMLGWFCFFYEIWALFFSPLASVSRFDVAFTTSVMCLIAAGSELKVPKCIPDKSKSLNFLQMDS